MPRGGVWRKPNPKLQGDEQKPNMRRNASGTSGHVTTKYSIWDWGAFCKSGVYAAKVMCLTPGDLRGYFKRLKQGVWRALSTVEKSAEGIVGGSHR